MRQSVVPDHEIDELPVAAAEAFEKYVAACLAHCWTGGNRAGVLGYHDVVTTQARFIRLLNHQKEWRWGGSTWRLGMYGVERVAG
jgi:hypothetical protein